MLKKLCMSSALLALIVSLTSLGFAQGSAESSVSGSISVFVSDPSGATISDAKVTINGATGTKAADTGADGRALFQVLPPGTYTVKVEKTGFKSEDIKDVVVVIGRAFPVNVKLEIGAASTTVEVTADAIAVDTTSTSQGANLNDQFYQSVPVGRGVTGLFYAASGVASGGGTGTANPSISGATGLENNYVADGVSITDGGFGGIGVYSRVYGSLSTGINLSFVKEVQVKTGGFEAQYGKSTGGIVQIVTKSGSSHFYGSVGGYFAPQRFESTRKFSDDFGFGGSDQRFNLQGKILHQSNYDVDAQIGGYVPGFKNHLFFFGAFNPQWNTDYDQFSQYINPSDLGTAGLGGPTQQHLGNFNVPVKVYSYSGKGTFKINDNHQIEASIFGDPTYGDNNANGNLAPQTASATTFDKLQYGTRNFVARYNGTMSPSWLINASWSWGHNNLKDTPGSPGVYQIVDLLQNLPCGAPNFNLNCGNTTDPLRGQFTRQGLGYFENTKGDTYGTNFDTSKSFHFLGQHNLSVGYRYDRSHYDGSKNRTGPNIPVDLALAQTITGDPDLQSLLVANGTNAAFQLRARGSSSCITNPLTGGPGSKAAEIYIPGLDAAPIVTTNSIGQLVQVNATCPDGGLGVSLRQTRGEFGQLAFKTTSNYHTLFAQDSWSPSKYVTINAGIRWEQQHVQGTAASYTFNDNWSPRVGISVDPWGNRKTKITANFGRYTESLPLDIAIRSLSQELDFSDTNWVPPTDGSGHLLIASDGTIDLSTLVGTTTPANPAGGYIRSFNSGASLQAAVAFAPHTRSEYLDEYVLGFEHEFGNSGVVFSARYTDRRIRRIIEDLAALSPESAQAGLAQQYFIGNPSKTTDYFTNPQQIFFTSSAGDFDPTLGYIGPQIAGCGDPATGVNAFYVQPSDSNGNGVTFQGNDGMCVGVPDGGTVYGPPCAAASSSGARAGDPCPDGVPDGFVDPQRVYKAVEFEVNKSMSKGWQMRANYRIARLVGNYEGSFRNDNNQSDPNISSLFDFTRGQLNLLGQQFVPGVLNTDVHHLANGFVSYTFGGNHAKGLTVGSSVHFQTGIPINNLYAHPVYANSGEIPFCADDTTNCASARGSLGRTSNFGSVDGHLDYPIRISEGKRLRLIADLFNVTNQRTQLRFDQNKQRTVGSGNADFQKPVGTGPSAVNGNTNPGYQRPFYARFGVKFEF